MKLLSNKEYLKKCILAIACFLAFILVFYWASGTRLHYEEWQSQKTTPQEIAAVINDGVKVEFDFVEQVDSLEQVSLYVGTFGRTNEGELIVALSEPDGTKIKEFVEPLASFTDYDYHVFNLNSPYPMSKDKPIHMSIESKGVPAHQGVSLWFGTSINTGRYIIPDKNRSTFTVNGETVQGKVSYYIAGRNYFWIGKVFWPMAIVAFVFFSAYVVSYAERQLRGKESADIRAFWIFTRYKFLIKQLVGRDFKRKYKRSVLGVGWSFLNPLLTMLVQYFVFSTLFKSSIDHFIVYLMTGIVIMGFFSESIGLGITSIIDNAHLINKVFMPKGIYPLSRVLSSLVNLLFTLVPLLVVTIASGLPVTKAMLLMPIGLTFLMLFCYGMVLILSTMMTLFNDTLFLWNVVSTLWMYLTPIFYPIDIIPYKFRGIYKLNPMYQYITFFRTVLINGQAPTPRNYLGCILSAVVILMIGMYVFRKNEDKFILYL